jgi:hypothetical protein
MSRAATPLDDRGNLKFRTARVIQSKQNHKQRNLYRFGKGKSVEHALGYHDAGYVPGTTCEEESRVETERSRAVHLAKDIFSAEVQRSQWVEDCPLGKRVSSQEGVSINLRASVLRQTRQSILGVIGDMLS